MTRLLQLLGIEPTNEEPPSICRRALDALHAHSLSEGRRRARLVLAKAHRCACCQGLLDHVFDRIGSTLFIDDDPRSLAAAFPANERDADCQEVLAALILLRGRPRTAPACA